MAVDNRLTADQLAGLVPGDPVTIPLIRDYRRPKHVPGAVLRLVGSRLVVSCRSDRGVSYVHGFALRDGVRVGSGGRAELVAADVPDRRRSTSGARLPAWMPPTASGLDTVTRSNG